MHFSTYSFSRRIPANCGVWVAMLLFSLIACRQEKPDAADKPTAPETFSFPADWVGDWAGTLNIWRPGVDTAQLFPMELHIKPTGDSSRWTWVIVYGAGEQRDSREYELVATDPEKGQYVIDEKNGILLRGYQVKNGFYGIFSVQGSLIQDVYRREGDALIFEIISSQLEAAIVSGDTILPDNDTIPPVLDYPIQVVQQAILHPIP